jgi:hypothetical protein
MNVTPSDWYRQWSELAELVEIPILNPSLATDRTFKSRERPVSVPHGACRMRLLDPFQDSGLAAYTANLSATGGAYYMYV